MCICLLSYCFLRLDVRTSDLVKIAETALEPEQERMAEITGNSGMRLCQSADAQKGIYPYTYRQIIRVVLAAATAVFILMGLVRLFSHNS